MGRGVQGQPGCSGQGCPYAPSSSSSSDVYRTHIDALFGSVATQIAGGQKYRPPRADVNAPDLYIPLLGAWTYCLLVCLVDALQMKYRLGVESSVVGVSMGGGGGGHIRRATQNRAPFTVA